MGPERPWFGLAACLDCTCLCFFEGVLGQFGGLKRFYFHAQLDHLVCMGQHEGRCVGGFCGNSTEKLLDEETNSMCYSRSFKNQSCSCRSLNRIICKALCCPSASCKVKILPTVPCFCHFPGNLGINSSSSIDHQEKVY